ncbi:ABC transporter ATP-binding protein [Bacillus cereus]|uniref:ABC transporter ATP-binding protein n=1 Tax=Bacillus cereus TaxID=1396 RepID=UPI0009531582|nr:ATP-binding cassette domain-containing protein [Bacillus cereus]OLR26827.1 ABC transporter [Bacillus cereus]
MLINVENLSKCYTVKSKAPGLKASLKNLVKPNYTYLTAVDNVNFTINQGEIVAFIGPNGAGKSTIIKMLTGILHPTNGTINIMSIDPWKNRRDFAFKIGTVFGQKSQLWYHLPPSEAFKLLGKIYELDEVFYNEQFNKLVQLFDLGDFLNTPVRKLSLGQRMRCEIAASLIHRPEVLFLDEPTIGLDVVGKRKIREALLAMNKEFNTTIILTSHDSGDIELLCQKAIVINKGHIIFNDSLNVLKKQFLKNQRVYMRFENNNIPKLAHTGIEVLKSYKNEIEFKIDTQKQSYTKIIREIMNDFRVEDFTIVNPSMEEIIHQIFTTKNLYK